MSSHEDFCIASLTKINLSIPDDRNILSHVLEYTLGEYFEDVNVKWVHCPDLTQKPYNLAAPGLCGKTAIIDMRPQKLYADRTYSYYIDDVIATLYKNKNINRYITPFIFGDTAALHEHNGICTVHDSTVNASFKSVNGQLASYNKSCLINLYEKNCQTYMLTGNRPICFGRGTFFLCEGLFGPVIQIYAKKLNVAVEKPEPNQFINCMHEAVQYNWNCSKNPIGLAGVYTTKNVCWQHNSIENQNLFVPKRRCLPTCTVEMPVTSFGILNSTAIGSMPSLGLINIPATTITRCLYHQSSAQNHYSVYESVDAEYFGYFTPVETLYHITT